ncbi:MAG: zinc ribbon domain-containing protein [Ignavibacteriales bacterium]|nr:zinc ribbon domain-containing protein [Ignavibacteriales bacterium]
MPTYEYKCSECGHTFEEFQSISAQPLTQCPSCGKQTLRRILGGGAGMIFKGQGFYLTDYKNKGGNHERKVAKKDTPEKKEGADAPVKKESTEKKD